MSTNTDCDVPIPENFKKFWQQIHYISLSEGVDYPFSPFVRYKYPPASPFIVLHLMNRMNLMPPFFFNSSYDDIKLIEDSDSSEGSESEILTSQCEKEILPFHSTYKRQKKKLKVGALGHNLEKISESYKRKREKFQPLDSFFDTIPIPPKPAFKLKVDTTSLKSTRIQEISDDHISHGFGKFEKTLIEDETKPETSEKLYKESVSDEELRRNLLRPEEWKDHLILRGYSTGVACQRLYVKNIAKSVVESDLDRIFSRYVDWNDTDQRNMYSIQYFKGGKLRGQAFITLPDEERAVLAVKETNTFKLKGKPIVVSFARSAKGTSSSTNSLQP